MIALHEIEMMIERLKRSQSRCTESSTNKIEGVIELAELIVDMGAKKTDLLAFIESLEAEVVK